MAARDDPFRPGLKVGPFEILREIGRGGMGRVYLAKDSAVGGRLVAIKVILAADQSDEAHERFLREVRNMARLHHSNIVTVFTAGEHEGFPYLVMDYVAGRDLTRFLDECSMLGATERTAKVVKAIAEVARAVHYAHSKGIVHRDLKPANILISHDGDEPMVLDFGIAKYLGDTSLTKADESPGTPAYRAPEQVDVGLKVREELIDVWALGVILYRTLTLTHPFKGNDALSVSLQVLHAEPEPPRTLNPRIPPAIESVIVACLQKNPAQRPETALAVAELLERALRAPLEQTPAGTEGRRLATTAPPPQGATRVLPIPTQAATTSIDQVDPEARTRFSSHTAWATLALAALLGIGTWAALHSSLWPQPKPPSIRPGKFAPTVGAAQAGLQEQAESAQMALGVMVFKNMDGNAQHDWWRDALRDGLNTQLSQLSAVKVYSKEFIDFLITRKGLTEIEAAGELGIRKMLSGSFVDVDGTLRIETHIVDVASGVMDSSYTTSGSDRNLPDLQNKLALGLISKLNLPVSADERKTLLAQRNTDAEALKLLLESEGGAGPGPEPGAGQNPGGRGPQSSLPLWLGLRDLVLPAAAWADQATDLAAIQAVIERYRRSTESRDVQALAALYTEFPHDQETAQEKYFANVRDLRVAIDNVDVAVVGDEAVASYTRVDDFIDARSSQPMHLAIRLTKNFRRENGEWKLALGK